MDTQADHQKRAIRAELRERRRTMTSSERESAESGLTARLIELAGRHDAHTIACYLSGQNEPNTRPFLNTVIADGMKVLFPITREDGLLDWTDGESGAEVIGLFGTPEAVGNILGPIAINDVDLIIVPAAAVDSTGMRLGWGRGFFDKTLGSMERCPPVYAVVFDGEFVDTVPSEVHDQRVNGVVTPTRIIEFSAPSPF
ncbi:5-formyltetrahydrofolate cyclo-ligase [Mycetocola reblochoni]|nr:5-formyltetrahydrofolate cyclo-ligase [Mycetocola reblochoni]RLP68420.1 5-formyltetrahydrofolate cyclo-ligase [Mycetocola reblochoni]